jgi:CRISPR-associated endonuclease/helicase Cas3
VKVEPVDLKSLYAHTPPEGSEKWDILHDHLVGVAQKARRFAEPFGAGALAYVIGLWHDLGKINPEFQAYLEAMHKGESHAKVPHSIWAGALGYALIWLGKKDAESWKELALPLAGHHSGLDQPGALSQKLHAFIEGEQGKKALCLLQKATTQLQLPVGMRMQHGSQRGRDLLIRMVFSALVDADYLATEQHFEGAKSDRRGNWPSLKQLWDVFCADQTRLLGEAEQSPSTVNDVRRKVYEACLDAAKKEPGLFRLTVPTGGGKTRSGLAFALQHALSYRKERVIVALPYTSIIDQTAREYRKIFDAHFDCVLEHHSQVDLPDEQEDQHPTAIYHRLAAENWDAPLVVTTTVQLFESLFGCKPGRCRKLHNIGNSVLILDEVQTLPSEFLAPTLEVIRWLVEYGATTVVFSTATQPAFDETPYLKAFDGLAITPIVEKYHAHFRLLERVDYQPVRQLQNLNELTDEIAERTGQQVLVILNTRKHAVALLNELRDRKVQGLYHLSTLLCGAHRKAILEDIKKRLALNDPQPVCLISTQVVEAGVDLDFPTVYRAMGPLDRIVQAAGRCNREGRRHEKGQVIIFDWPENASPPGSYRIGLDDAKMLLQRNSPARLNDPELYREYFQCLFRDADLDKRDILPCCRDLNFPEVAQRYKFVEETIPVVVPCYDNSEGEKRLQAYMKHPSRETWRRLMTYVVNIRRQELNSLQCWLEPAVGAFYRWTGIYDAETHRGLVGPLMDPADLLA